MTNSIASTTGTIAAPQGDVSKRPTIDDGFAAELTRKVDAWIGAPGTEYRAEMEKRVPGLLGEPDANGDRHFDLAQLSDKKMAELKKLEKASQDFEAIFVKGLLSQMRKSSFAEKTDEMGDMAKDMMDQAVAESVSRGSSTLGIAKTIFMEMAQRVVKTEGAAQAQDK
ncbi:MAG TPA: rod-binding protein [Fimbriimonadaceae bacterium]|nr:rod-binding protein [Fimbriimonadaceae bacterium]